MDSVAGQVSEHHGLLGWILNRYKVMDKTNMALQITNQETKDSINTILESSQKLSADCAKLVKSNKSSESETRALRGSNDKLKVSLQKQESFISSLVAPPKERPSKPNSSNRGLQTKTFQPVDVTTALAVCLDDIINKSFSVTLFRAELNKLFKAKLQEVKLQYDNQLKEVKSQYDYQLKKLKSQYEARLKDFKSKDQSLEEQIDGIMSNQPIRGSTTLLDYLTAAPQLQEADEWHTTPRGQGLGQ
ncbi:hypothetical protein ACHAP5_008383 [Fusarium lateritium]